MASPKELWLGIQKQKQNLAAAGLVIASIGLASCEATNPPRPESGATPKPTEIVKVDFPPTFAGRLANEAAKEAEIRTDDFFIFKESTLNRVTAFVTSKRLLPIFPPAVMAQEEAMLKIQEETEMAINVIATVMSIESAGFVNAGSHMGAIGLMQPLQDKFPASIRGNWAAMTEPLTNIRAGARYFMDVCLPAARSGFPDSKKDHAQVYARALMSYNGGPGGGMVRDFNQIIKETQFYGDHFQRYAITAEIAHRMRQKGATDQQIISELSGSDIDARAWALQTWANRMGGVFSYEQYMQILRELVKPLPGYNTAIFVPNLHQSLINRDYGQFRTLAPYRTPLSPGTRIWVAFGGLGLFSLDSRNIDPEAYKQIQTKQ